VGPTDPIFYLKKKKKKERKKKRRRRRKKMYGRYTYTMSHKDMPKIVRKVEK